MLATIGLFVQSAVAAPSSLNNPLLEHLVGTWVLRGEIAGKPVTHAVTAQWVLGHEYIQIHETSQLGTAGGAPQYEAIVYIGWDPDLKQYACLWLDSTGGDGLVGWALGHAPADVSQLAFLFLDKSGEPSLHNTFAYDDVASTWTWTIDNVDKGQIQSFARLKLTRH